MKKNKPLQSPVQKIIDVCCGGKMMYFDKKNTDILFIDERRRARGFMKTRPNFEINPDLQADFTKLPFVNNHFSLVIFDPPHTIRNKKEGGIIAERYGRFTKENWQSQLAGGFKECWRILGPAGVLIFKWNEQDKKLKDIEKFFPIQPLFGTRCGSRDQTIWLCFYKK